MNAAEPSSEIAGGSGGALDHAESESSGILHNGTKRAGVLRVLIPARRACRQRNCYPDQKRILGECAKRVRCVQGKTCRLNTIWALRAHQSLLRTRAAVRRITGAKHQAPRGRFGYRCRNADYEWRLFLEGLNEMSDRFPIFEIVLERRRRSCVWAVRTNEGMLVITGSRSSRSAARYEAHRALFLMLLSAPYRSRTSGREIQVSQASARRSLP